MIHHDRWKRLTLATATTLALLACAPAPPVHPLGAACTWPAVVDVDGDGLAILQHSYAGDAEIALVEIDTGAVRARCSGLRSVEFAPRFAGAAPEGPLGVFPSLSPDRRFGVVPGGVIDMAAGTVPANPDPGWPAVGLAGDAAVLRHDESGGSSGPEGFCVAPRPDSPQSECAPVTGSGAGVPVVHTDGTVGWAPAVAVPITLTAQDGRTVVASTQTDGVDVVRLQLTDPAQGYLGDFGSAVSRRDGRLSDSDARLGLGLDGQLAWYTTDPGAGTGQIRLSPYSQDDAVAFSGVAGAGRSSAVVEDGAALLLVVNGSSDVAIVRVAESGPPTTALRFRTGPADDPSTAVRAAPIILDWPVRAGASPR